MAILGIALGVGAIAYALSLRDADETLTLRPPDGADGEPPPAPPPAVRRRRRPRAVGFGPEEVTPAEPSGSVYVPLSADETPWQRRVGGLVGLVVLVAVAAAVLAGVIYQAGHLINQTIARFLK